MRPGAAFERRMKIAEPRLETIINPFLIPRLFPLMLVHHVAGMTFLWSCSSWARKVEAHLLVLGGELFGGCSSTAFGCG